MISVAIPAHNESVVIDRLLGGLAQDAADGAFEVVVVANGCSDETASRASAYAGVKVVELGPGSKTAALNEADRHLESFPRFYVDADTQFTGQDLRTLAQALEAPGVMAVAPALVLDASASSWIVRSYTRLWSELPAVRLALSSRGCFGVSEEGRRRWETFPDVVNDDRYVHSQFEPKERAIVPTVRSVIEMPANARQVVRRRMRVEVGNSQLATDNEAGSDQPDSTAWLRVVASEPRLAIHAPAYVGLTLAAKAKARRYHRQATNDVWADGRASR